jgi:hypothetical protein
LLQENLTQKLTQIIEFIRGIVDSVKIYLLGHPVEVGVIIGILVVAIILLYYLPKILAALYKDLKQLFIIFARWAVFAIIIIFMIWIVASFPTTCALINQHLGTELKCETLK